MKYIKLMCAIFIFVSQTVFADASPDKVVLVLDWFLNPDHAPIFVAKQQGFFQKRHLQVEWVTPADPADPPKLVAAKKADIAITYHPALVMDVTQGLPLVRIASLVDSPLNCLVVDEKGPVLTFHDLKNKTIGMSVSVDPSLSGMLSHYHLSSSDVNLINVHYNLTQALLLKKVDAVIGVLRNFEVIQLELAGFKPRLFLPEKNGVPSYDEFIFVTHKDHARDAKLIRFVEAVNEGNRYLQSHPEEMWQAFSKQYPENDNELNHRAWFATLPYFSHDPFKFSPQKYEKFAEFLKRQYLIQKVPPIESYTINRH